MLDELPPVGQINVTKNATRSVCKKEIMGEKILDYLKISLMLGCFSVNLGQIML